MAGDGLETARLRYVLFLFLLILYCTKVYIQTSLRLTPPKDDAKKNSPLETSLRLEPLCMLFLKNCTNDYYIRLECAWNGDDDDDKERQHKDISSPFVSNCMLFFL